MNPGDLVKFVAGLEDDTEAIMTVLRVQAEESKDDGWSFCTSGRKSPTTVEVFYPGKGIRRYQDVMLDVISDNHSSPEHAKLTALAFAGTCSSRPGDCSDG